MPAVGLGTYLIDDADVGSVVDDALRLGYRHVDTAEGYGNEAGIGASLAAAIGAGVVTRDDVFVTTKLFPGNPEWGQAAKTSADVAESLEASLERLQLDAVDLYLIHASFGREQALDLWGAMLEVRDRGLARHVGVSNFNVDTLEAIRHSGLEAPAANQIELHPWSQKPELVAYLHEHNITPIAYSSLVPLSTWRAADGQASAKQAEWTAEAESSDFVFADLARRHEVSEAQVLLRWAIQHGFPVIPKSTKADRLRANLDLFGFELTDEEMTLMDSLDRGAGVAWQSGDPLTYARR
ncbi:MAG: aldo/keto reductase [Thermoleophilia bacterium]|nr:aldo/keto reductase [Thermoleophilia bacterium]